MKNRISQSKTMARQSLLGHYGTASGALLLALFMNLGLLVLWESLYIALDVSGIPWSLRRTGYRIVKVFSYLVLAALGAVWITGEFRICHEICAGREGRPGDLFFALFCCPLRFAGLWLAFLLAGLAALVPGGMLFLLASTDGRQVGLGLRIAGGLVSAALELVVTVWSLVTLAVAMERIDASARNPYQEEYWSAWECLGAGWKVVAGRGWQLLGLVPGFLGMYVLGCFSCGIGFLWVIPYMFSTVIWLCREAEPSGDI